MRVTWEPTLAEWQAEGWRRFGPETDRWLFVCPSCRNVQSPADFKRLGMYDHQVARFAAHACIRRWSDGGCTFTGGPVLLIVALGDFRPTLPFAHARPRHPDPQPDRPGR